MSVQAALDYPSQRRGRRTPPLPMLLDTCLLQHLEFVMDLLGDALCWPAGSTSWLLRRYGEQLGGDLIALGEIIAFLLPRQPPPWIVSETSLLELQRLGGAKGSRLRAWWYEWAEFWEGCAEVYPEILTEALAPPVTSIAPGQLALFEIPSRSCRDLEAGTPLGSLPDAGDRALVRDAIRCGIPAVLTTDLRSLWSHRQSLYAVGVEVWRPRDMLTTLAAPQAATTYAA
jgi:hypothetical protein